VADEVARTVEQSLAQAQRLRQSILKKAFEGKLVAQDAEDEPAGVLVERIRQQKQIKEKNNKPTKRKIHG
jgi:type I restriction enzyme S subunit